MRQAFRQLFVAIGMFVSLVFLVSCSQELHHGLTEEQANEMVVTLANNGINATKVPVEGEVLSFTLTVPKRDSSQAWEILQANNLPKPPKKGFGEVFAKTSLIPTAVEEKAMYMQAVMGELEKTLLTITGVVEARVHVVLPESDVLKEELQGPTVTKAAVLLKYKPDRSGAIPFREDDVKNLVANSVEGLKPPDVAVVVSEISQDRKPDMVYAGPIKVSKDSLFPFQILVVVVVLLFVLVGFLLAMAARSSMALRKELESLRAAMPSSNLPELAEK
jgi:type III secretion protein J